MGVRGGEGIGGRGWQEGGGGEAGQGRGTLGVEFEMKSMTGARDEGSVELGGMEYRNVNGVVRR